MRISQLIARAEDKVIANAPRAKHAVLSATSKAAASLSVKLGTLSAKASAAAQPKPITDDEVAQ